MQPLNLPVADFRIIEQQGKTMIFDRIRKKYVTLTQEEWVRQNFLAYLISVKQVPASLIGVEVSMKVNRLPKRGDIVVYDRTGNPCLIVECKAPGIPITQAVFDQIARYNMTLKVKFLVVTNGMEHFACLINHEESSYVFLREIPGFQDMQ